MTLHQIKHRLIDGIKALHTVDQRDIPVFWCLHGDAPMTSIWLADTETTSQDPAGFNPRRQPQNQDLTLRLFVDVTGFNPADSDELLVTLIDEIDQWIRHHPTLITETETEPVGGLEWVRVAGWDTAGIATTEGYFFESEISLQIRLRR